MGKHHSDVDNHVIKNEHDITDVSGLVGDNAFTQKGKVNGLLANNARIFGKEIFCGMLPTCTKHYAEKNVPGWVWGQG